MANNGCNNRMNHPHHNQNPNHRQNYNQNEPCGQCHWYRQYCDWNGDPRVPCSNCRQLGWPCYSQNDIERLLGRGNRQLQPPPRQHIGANGYNDYGYQPQPQPTPRAPPPPPPPPPTSANGYGHGYGHQPQQGGMGTNSYQGQGFNPRLPQQVPQIVLNLPIYQRGPQRGPKQNGDGNHQNSNPPGFRHLNQRPVAYTKADLTEHQMRDIRNNAGPFIRDPAARSTKLDNYRAEPGKLEYLIEYVEAMRRQEGINVNSPAPRTSSAGSRMNSANAQLRNTVYDFSRRRDETPSQQNQESVRAPKRKRETPSLSQESSHTKVKEEEDPIAHREAKLQKVKQEPDRLEREFADIVEEGNVRFNRSSSEEQADQKAARPGPHIKREPVDDDEEADLDGHDHPDRSPSPHKDQ